MYAMFTTILALDFLLQTTIVDPAVLKDGDAPGDAVVRGLCRILPIAMPNPGTMITETQLAKQNHHFLTESVHLGLS